MASRVVVTGAAGFLGSAIVRALSREGITVKGTGRGRKGGEGADEFISADILEGASLVPVVNCAEAVIHAAGLAHVFDRRGAMKSAFWRVNADGTENVVKAAAQVGVRHFVLISSTSVYGPHKGTVTEDCPCRPVGAYAESKLEAENRARQIARESGMRLTILRPVTAYGEGDRGNVLRLMHAVDCRRFVWIGDGRNRKSLLHRDDVAAACAMALSRPPVGDVTLNVAGPACEMREVLSAMARELGRSVPQIRVPVEPLAIVARLLGRISPTLAGGRNGLLDSLQKWIGDDVYDGSRLQQLLGWQPRVSLSEGLRREVSWYRSVQRSERH